MGLAVAAIAAFAMVGAACGDDNGGNEENAQAVEQTVRDIFDAFNRGDGEAALAYFTDEGYADIFGEFPREEVISFLSEPLDPPNEIVEIEVDAGDEEATATIESVEFGFRLRQDVGFVLQDGQWMVNSYTPLTQDVPDDTDAVDVALAEYSFNFDESEITSGNLAFNIENIGGELHEMALFRVPEDLDIEAAIQSEEEPEDVEEVGFAGPWVPGAELTAIVAEELQPGRYAMLCFIPTADGTPHAALGMWAEFTIDGDGAGNGEAEE